MTTPDGKDPSASGNNDPANNGTSGDTNNTPKTVPEADFIALKRSSETQAQELQSKLDAVNTELEQERAGRKSAEEKAAQVETLTQQKTELEGKLTTAQEQYTALQTRELNAARKNLVDNYKVPEEKANTLSLDQIQLMVDTLPAPAPGSTFPNARNMDLDGNRTSTDTSQMSALEKIRAGYDSNSK